MASQDAEAASALTQAMTAPQRTITAKRYQQSLKLLAPVIGVPVESIATRNTRHIAQRRSTRGC